MDTDASNDSEAQPLLAAEDADRESILKTDSEEDKVVIVHGPGRAARQKPDSDLVATREDKPEILKERNPIRNKFTTANLFRPLRWLPYLRLFTVCSSLLLVPLVIAILFVGLSIALADADRQDETHSGTAIWILLAVALVLLYIAVGGDWVIQTDSTNHEDRHKWDRMPLIPCLDKTQEIKDKDEKVGLCL